jgi:hypothetical protein
VLSLTWGTRFVFISLVVPLFWWLFNFVAPTCLVVVVVVVLHGSVGDVDCCRGVASFVLGCLLQYINIL